MPVATPLLRPGPYDRPTSDEDRAVDLPGSSDQDAIPFGTWSIDLPYMHLQPPPRAAPPEAPSRQEAVLRGQVDALLSTLPPAVQAAVVDALADLTAPSTLDEELWGAPPSDVAYLRAAARSATRIAEQEDALLGGGRTVEETATRLDVDAVAVRDRIGRGELVAMERDNAVVLPAWQFTEGSRAVLPGISKIRQAFPGHVLSLSTWMVAPNDRLGGRAPRELLVEGETERVAAVARAIGS